MAARGSNDDRDRAGVTVADAERLARLIGLEIPAEDRVPLAEALTEHQTLVAAFDGIAETAGLAGDDLTRALPRIPWDPRWR